MLQVILSIRLLVGIRLVNPDYYMMLPGSCYAYSVLIFKMLVMNVRFTCLG